MWTTAILAFVWVGLLPHFGESTIDDFEDTYQQYDIMYHRNYHLLLAIHGDTCYFVNTPVNKESTLDDDSTLLVSRLQATERSLLRHITTNASGEVVPSTLQAVRAKYRDLLADFHCMNKRIFEVNLYHSTATIGNIPSCEGKPPGMHEDPRDCHAFLLCDGSNTFYEMCAPGTAFVESSQTCEHTSLVHTCN
ncbi:uncharacterized protein LOC143275678 [Babylonia areolata]|uniref:uncharacterized protein LOC143275678 n=1 Tax=Babylonia areolata TaxID=304850 RepID=UPI003FD32786